MSAGILREIARRTGVSERTVLRVLGGGRTLKRPTVIARAERIRELAAELDYRPNAAARAVVTGRFGALGVLMSARLETVSHLPDPTLQGMLRELARRGMTLTVAALEDEAMAAGRMPRLLAAWSVDALVVNYQCALAPEQAARLERLAPRAVWLNCRRPHDCIHPDDEGAGAAATEVLLRLGHRRIAFLDTHTIPARREGMLHYSLADRRAGYVRAMNDAGLAPRIVEDDFRPGPDSGRCALALLGAADRPTAVVCPMTREAYDALAAAERLGLRVPTDLSVIHCAGMPGATYVACLRVPELEMGVEAVRRALARAECDEPQPPLALPAALEPGRTLAPPPQQH